MWLPVNGTCQQAKAAETQDASQLVATATTPNATAGELLLTPYNVVVTDAHDRSVLTADDAIRHEDAQLSCLEIASAVNTKGFMICCLALSVHQR
jgi:hypothetical protein